MSKDNTSRATVKNFIHAYFEHELEKAEPEFVERKRYNVFKRRMRAGAIEGLTVSKEQLQALYTLATGESATYVREPIIPNPRPENVTRALEDIALRAYDMLDSYPQSVTDICEKAKSCELRDCFADLRGYYWGGDKYRPIRDCFREMAKRGLVGMHEVNTCGRCHIRVYYRL